MSSVKTINRAVLLIWLSYVCQAFIIVYFSKFQKAQKYENQISVAGFRELFMCLFFVNSCVTKNIIQLKFYLIIKLLTLLLLVPRFITVITQTTIYIILGLLLLLFFDISLYFFYYKTLSIMYKKYYFTRFGASEDLKAIFWVYIALTMEENILFIASRYPLPLHLEAIISPLVASIFYINSMQKEYPIRRYFAIFALEVQFLVNILLFIVYAPAFRGEM